MLKKGKWQERATHSHRGSRRIIALAAKEQIKFEEVRNA